MALRAVRVGGFGGRGSPAISSWRPPPPLPLPPPLPPVDCCVGGGRGGPTVARRLADDPTLPSSESHAEAVPRTTGDARATPGINVLLACRRTRNWSTRARRVASSCACISASASTCTTHRATVSPCTRHAIAAHTSTHRKLVAVWLSSSALLRLQLLLSTVVVVGHRYERQRPHTPALSPRRVRSHGHSRAVGANTSLHPNGHPQRRGIRRWWWWWW